MYTLRMPFLNSHPFVLIDGRNYLLDTGAPTSFFTVGPISLCGECYDRPASFVGVDAEKLTDMIGVPVAGVIGTDILNQYDCLLDIGAEQVTFSRDELACDGTSVDLDDIMGVPIVDAELDGETRRMFFDTGAPLSYFQGDSLENYPSAGPYLDFFVGYGRFETSTHLIESGLGDLRQVFRFGRMPGILGTMLTRAGVEGIIGIDLLRTRKAWYSPRRRKLVLEN